MAFLMVVKKAVKMASFEVDSSALKMVMMMVVKLVLWMVGKKVVS